MAEKRYGTSLLIALAVLPTLSCADRGSSQEETVFTKIPEIAEIRPERPVKIKLKRNADGEYSWELNGDDAEKVIQADVKLKEAIKP